MNTMYTDVTTHFNPFVGCLFGCFYCKLSYQNLVKRAGSKLHCPDCMSFTPHIHPERLKTPLPGQIFWPCNTGDISFGEPAYIKKIMAHIKRYSHKYQEIYWQSKKPECFNQYLGDLSENAVLLTTIETNRDAGYEQISRAPLPSIRAIQFANVKWKKKLITLEPLLDFDLPVLIEWIDAIHPQGVWVGYANHNPKLPIPEPSLLKVYDLISELTRKGYSVRTKTIRQASPCYKQTV